MRESIRLTFPPPPTLSLPLCGLTAEPGVCLHCGCTEEAACEDPETHLPCAWANAAHTCCTLCALFYAAEVCGSAEIIHLLE